MHKFTYENTYPEQLPVKVEFTIPSDASLDDMCQEFTNYLKACGFHIPEGNVLDIVPEDGYSSKGWDSFEPDVTEDFDPRDSFYRPSPFNEYGNYGENNPPVGGYEFNSPYKNVTVTYNGVKYSEHE